MSPSMNLPADTKPKSNLSPANHNSIDNVDSMIDEIPENVQISQNLEGQRYNNGNIICSASDSNCSPPQLRKRNVNWCSPIKSHSSQSTAARESVKFIQTTANGCDRSRKSDDDAELIESQRNGNAVAENAGADDDGFESLNGKSSSGEEVIAVRHNVGHAIESSNGDNEIVVRNNIEQYGNSAYPTGSYDENDLNNNSDNDDLINGTTNVLENVSKSLHILN